MNNNHGKGSRNASEESEDISYSWQSSKLENRAISAQYSKQVNLQLQLQFSYPRKRQVLPATVIIIGVSLPVLCLDCSVLKFWTLPRVADVFWFFRGISAAFSMVIIHQLVYICMRPIRNHIIVVPKWVTPNRNHMNDVVEVNGLPPQCYQALSSKRKSLSTGYTLCGFLPKQLISESRPPTYMLSCIMYCHLRLQMCTATHYVLSVVIKTRHVRTCAYVVVSLCLQHF